MPILSPPHTKVLRSRRSSCKCLQRIAQSHLTLSVGVLLGVASATVELHKIRETITRTLSRISRIASAWSITTSF